jgi:hypothetical protein
MRKIVRITDDFSKKSKKANKNEGGWAKLAGVDEPILRGGAVARQKVPENPGPF